MELLRQQHGGCESNRPEKACKLDPNYRGASFTYLAANVIDKATGKTLLPAYKIEEAKGVKVAFIGAVLKDAPSLLLPSAVAGMSFLDEADSINKALAEVRAKGATVFVVLIHEGGHTDEAFNEPDCRNLKGPIVSIAKRLDPEVKLIISGHTHTGLPVQGGRPHDHPGRHGRPCPVAHQADGRPAIARAARRRRAQRGHEAGRIPGRSAHGRLPEAGEGPQRGRAGAPGRAPRRQIGSAQAQ